MEVALGFVLSATVTVPAGAELSAALARAAPGDVVRLGPGEHRGSLGRPSGISVEGAGAGVTVVRAPEGVDGAVAEGELSISGLSLVAGPARCALKVLGGVVRLRDVALAGGACGAFVEDGRLEGRDVVLTGNYGLLARSGEVSLAGGSARGRSAGLAVMGGTLSLRRFALAGPSREAALTVSRGTASLEGVVIRAPGPSGIAVSAGGRVEGVGVSVVGASADGGFLGDCVQVIRGAVRLEGSLLAGCAGAATEASKGEVSLVGVDATGGGAGCLVLVNGTTADLAGNLCTGRGPGLVVASGARATARANRWWTDPVFWVDCGSGARVALGRGESAREPCTGAR